MCAVSRTSWSFKCKCSVESSVEPPVRWIEFQVFTLFMLQLHCYFYHNLVHLAMILKVQVRVRVFIDCIDQWMVNLWIYNSRITENPPVTQKTITSFSNMTMCTVQKLRNEHKSCHCFRHHWQPEAMHWKLMKPTINILAKLMANMNSGRWRMVSQSFELNLN